MYLYFTYIFEHKQARDNQILFQYDLIDRSMVGQCVTDHILHSEPK